MPYCFTGAMIPIWCQDWAPPKSRYNTRYLYDTVKLWASDSRHRRSAINPSIAIDCQQGESIVRTFSGYVIHRGSVSDWWLMVVVNALSNQEGNRPLKLWSLGEKVYCGGENFQKNPTNST